jgi:hypothetical protein
VYDTHAAINTGEYKREGQMVEAAHRICDRDNIRELSAASKVGKGNYRPTDPVAWKAFWNEADDPE